jgi:hypothetical protein
MRALMEPKAANINKIEDFHFGSLALTLIHAHVI